jgi:hypothetical protein
MEHYVTLFDSLFLPQGIALHISMERHIKEYTLWILCVDDEAYDVLNKIKLPNSRLLQLSSLETVELLRVKPTRSKGEYCWTLTPFAPMFVFQTDASVDRVTYLDADLWFRMHPKPIFDEFDDSAKDVLITEHAYAPEYDQSEISGKYCVQFIIFTRKGGEAVREWWGSQCIEWCYARPEDGKFGDQKYLDDWPERFASHVHVLQDKERALAPWNANRFPYSNAIFYHLHGLRIISEKRATISTYQLPSPLMKYVYIPYLIDLRVACNMLQATGWKVKSQLSRLSRIRNFLKILYRFFLSFKNITNLHLHRKF